nr:movement protein [Grapevine virus P]
MSSAVSRPARASSSKDEAVRIFKVGKNTESLGDLTKQLSRSHVYNNEMMERMFPSRCRKCVVHKEIVVENGQVDLEMELMDMDVLDGIDEEKLPFYHFGSVVTCVLPNGKTLKGSVLVRLKDGRLKEGSDVVSSFTCDLGKQLSAFADFPGYFISTSDLKQGFTLKLCLLTDALEFKEGTHPFSVATICIGRFCSADLESRALISHHGRHLYQPLLNSDLEISKVPKHVHVQEIPNNLVMSEVYDTIKRLGLKTNGSIVREVEAEGDSGGSGDGFRSTHRGCN